MKRQSFTNDLDVKSVEEKKRDETRRVEIAMLGLLIEKYPKETRERVRKLPPEFQTKSFYSANEKSL